MPDQFIYSVQDKELFVTDIETGKLTWKGKPNQLDVLTVIPIPETNDCIVLLKYSQPGSYQKNLLRLDPYGRIKWEPGLPIKTLFGLERTDQEIYLAVKLDDNRVIGTTFSGFIDFIDIETGQILDSVFVK
jgi:hypothetical protein